MGSLRGALGFLGIVACFGLGGAWACTSGGAVQEPAPAPGALRVTVVDSRTSLALAGATVRIADQARTTGADGGCLFPSVPVGPAGISVTRSGYETAWLDADVASSQLVEARPRLTPAAAPVRYDVVVVGAGTGGFAAAVQAARLGARVALVEESDWIGGQMTAAAVTSLDEGANIPGLRSGIYEAFVGKITSHYRALRKSTGTAYFNPRTIAFEPSVGQRKLYELLRETDQARGPGRAAVELFLDASVVGVQRDGPTITGVALGDGTLLGSGVVVEATEFGDLLPLAGARYRVGRSMSGAVDFAACTQFITYTAVIRKYASGTPADLLPQAPPPGYAEVQPRLASVVTNDGNLASVLPVSFVYHNAWRGMPDSTNPADYDASRARMALITRTGVNWFNDWAVTLQYVEDRAHRAAVNCQAKLRTLQLIHYLQRDLAHHDWSVADDEGFDTSFNVRSNACPDLPPALKPLERLLPVKPYVREARRAIGMTTLRAADIRREGSPPMPVRVFPTALAVGDYPVDLHGCRAAADLDCGETASDIPPWRGGPFQVPFEVFVPEALDGLVLAEKNLSVSRLVNGAIRLQPITMMTGQAAGALAALAALRAVPPRQIRPLQVQAALLDEGCVLSVWNPSDVPRSHPYWKATQLALVHGLVARPGPHLGVDDGIVSSEAAHVVGTAFGVPVALTDPAAPMTRGDFVLLLATAMALDLAQAPTSQVFVDVQQSHPAFRAVQALAALGTFGPGPGPLFAPDEPLTRGAATFFVVNAALATGAVGVDVDPRIEPVP